MSVAFDGETVTPLIPSAVLDRDVISAVLWFYGLPEGVESGSFMNALMTAFVKADRENFDRLEQGFPIVGYWVRALKNDPDGTTRAVIALQMIRAQS